MAWIELHQSLPGHRKIMRLRRTLKIGQAQAVGHLCMLWLWCLDSCPDGNLSDLMDCEIAEAAGYDGKKPEGFVSALLDVGFLDADRRIHDWWQYAGKLIDKREQNAQRMREKRAREEHVQRTCNARANTDTHIENARAGLPYPTVPNRTQPYPTVPNPTQPELPPIAPVAVAPAPAPDRPTDPPKPSAQDRRFDEFWDFYPKRVGKLAARKSWDKIRPDDALHKRMLTAIVKAKKSDQWTRDNGQFIPNPATWLNQGRWDDEIENVQSVRSPPQPGLAKAEAFMELARRYEEAGE